MNQSDQRLTFNIASVKEKFTNKREIYNFLTVDCGAYLPPFKDINTFYLKDLITGKKKVTRGHNNSWIYSSFQETVLRLRKFPTTITLLSKTLWQVFKS